jgi:MFS family permease
MRTSLWRDREFVKYWGGQTVSDLGDQISLLALPLTAVITLQATAGQMGMLVAFETAPTFLFSLVAGVWIDRLARRRILIASDVGRAILLATVPLAYVLGLLSLTQMYVVGFAVGTLSVFHLLAHQAYLPGLVGRERIVEANGTMNASRSLAELAGPTVAGFLVQAFTAPMPVVVDAVSFVASALGVSSVRRPESKPTPRARPDMRAEIQEGMALLLGHPVLRALVTTASILVLVVSAQTAIFILYLSRDVRLDPPLIGVILAAQAVGAFVGSMLASNVAKRVGIGPSFMLGTFVAASTLLGRGIVSGPTAVVVGGFVALQIVGWFGAGLFNVNGPSLRQALTPSGLLGRVNASYRFLVWGTGPLGALLGGTLGELLGLREALLVTGAISLLAVPMVLTSPLPRVRRVEPVAVPAVDR